MLFDVLSDMHPISEDIDLKYYMTNRDMVSFV